MVQFLARGMTSPLREMAAAAPRRWPRATTTRRVDGDARATRWASWPGVQPHGRRAGRGRPAAPRPGGQRVATSCAPRSPPCRRCSRTSSTASSQPDPSRARARCSTRSERLGRLVTQLLDLSRLESGTVPLAPRAVPVSAAARPMRPRRPRCTHPDRRCEVVVDAARPRRRRRPRARPPGGGQPARERGALRTRGQPVRRRRAEPRRTSGVVHRGARRRSRHPRRATAPGSSSASTAPTTPGLGDGGAGLGLAIARWIVDLHGGDDPGRRRPDGPTAAAWWSGSPAEPPRRSPPVRPRRSPPSHDRADPESDRPIGRAEPPDPRAVRPAQPEVRRGGPAGGGRARRPSRCARGSSGWAGRCSSPRSPVAS